MTMRCSTEAIRRGRIPLKAGGLAIAAYAVQRMAVVYRRLSMGHRD